MEAGDALIVFAGAGADCVNHHRPANTTAAVTEVRVMLLGVIKFG